MLWRATLRRAVNQQTRFVTSHKRLGELANSRRTTILLFRKIVGFLKHEPLAEPETILGYIKGQLDNTLTNVRSPQVIYERVINFLLGRKYAYEAVFLYQHMHDTSCFEKPRNYVIKSWNKIIIEISSNYQFKSLQ